MYDHLLQKRTLLRVLEEFANQLRTCHLEWEDRLARRRPGRDLATMASGNGDPTPLPACQDALLPDGADSSSGRQAPMAGPLTEGEEPMQGVQLALSLPTAGQSSPTQNRGIPQASGEKGKARDILAA